MWKWSSSGWSPNPAATDTCWSVVTVSDHGWIDPYYNQQFSWCLSASFFFWGSGNYISYCLCLWGCCSGYELCDYRWLGVCPGVCVSFLVVLLLTQNSLQLVSCFMKRLKVQLRIFHSQRVANALSCHIRLLGNTTVSADVEKDK